MSELAGPLPQPPKRRAVQTSISLDVEHDALLTALADAVTGGNRTKAVVHLIDVHAGHEILKAREREEPVETTYVVTKWKQPRLSTELIAYVAGIVRAGNLPNTACDLAAVTPAQRERWLKKGRNDRAAGKQSLEADFVTALGRAEAETEVERIKRMQELGWTNYRAIAWLLERQYPDKYGERKRIDKTTTHAVWPAVDFDKLTAAETSEFVRLLKKMSPDEEDPGIGRFARPALELLPADVVDGEIVTIEDEAPALDGPKAPPLEAPALEGKSPGTR